MLQKKNILLSLRATHNPRDRTHFFVPLLSMQISVRRQLLPLLSKYDQESDFALFFPPTHLPSPTKGYSMHTVISAAHLHLIP